MLDDLKKTITESIKKNLPAEVGEVLKNRLIEADCLEKENINLSKKLEESEKECEELYYLKRDVGALKGQKYELDQKEAALNALYIKFEHLEEIVELKRQHAQEKISDNREILLAVFANNVVKYETFKSKDKSIPVKDQYGSTTYDNQNESETETTKKTG